MCGVMWPSCVGDVEYDEPAGFTTLETVMSKGKDAGTLVVSK
jgi:hypothetical protein